MILLCPVTCLAQRKIIIMITKNPNSLPGWRNKHFLSLAGHLLTIKSVLGAESVERWWFRKGGGEILETAKAIRVTLGSPRLLVGSGVQGLFIGWSSIGTWNTLSWIWVRFQLCLYQVTEAWLPLNLLQGPQSQDGWPSHYPATTNEGLPITHRIKS